MRHSSSLQFRESKNMRLDHDKRKLAGHRRFRSLSHIKFTDIFKSLRRRRIHRKAPHQSPLDYSRGFPTPDSSFAQLLPDPSSLFIPLYRCRAESIFSVTEEDCSSGTSTFGSSPDHDAALPDVQSFLRCASSTFPASSSTFQLRSISTGSYLVERLEQHLRQLNLRDASPDQNHPPRDIPMDVSLNASSWQRIIESDPTWLSPASLLLEANERELTYSSHDQNAVPMMMITSVDAKHAKRLPPSDRRPSKTLFGPSSSINHPINVLSTKSKLNALSDDPFTTTPPHGFGFPVDYNLGFHVPSFPPAYTAPSPSSPETPTPMCCDHFGDCRGDLWEIFHPPLVAGAFTLPPFELPRLSAGLFDDVVLSDY